MENKGFIRRGLAATLVAIGLAAAATGATAAPVNLLANAGFESGDFSGWTIGGNSTTYGVATDGTPIPASFSSVSNVRSGTYSAYASVAQYHPVEIFELSQTISVLASTTYSIGYYAGVDSTNSTFGFGNVPFDCGCDPVDILIDGVSISASHPGIISSGSGPGDFLLVSSTFTTGAAQTSLTVGYRAGASGSSVGLSLDDFYFIGEAPVQVPAPATLALLGAGLAAVGAMRRRNRA